MSEQLYQVWDWMKGDVRSYHPSRSEAEQVAERLNAQSAFDANGLKRYQAGEAND